MRLIRELKDAEERLKRLRTGLARLLAEDEPLGNRDRTGRR